MAKVAIYARVSTTDQTTQQQLDELHEWAARAGHEVVEVYQDKGISGAKGREHRDGFDAMLKDAARRKFDVLAVWSGDRLGRSMGHLVDVIETLKASGVNLYIPKQGIDTTSPMGRAFFYMSGVFAEIERDMIVARVNAGMARAQRTGTKSGKAIGRPRASAWTPDSVRAALLTGAAVRKVSRDTGASPGTVHAARLALVAEGKLSASRPTT